MKKKLFSIVLMAALCFTLAVPASATMEVFSAGYIFSKEQPMAMTLDAVFALKSDDSLWAWGNNKSGAIGNGKGFETYFDKNIKKWVEPYVDTPHKIISNVKDFSAEQTWAITKDNALWVWGKTAVLLGLASNAQTSTPQKYMDGVKAFCYGEYAQYNGEPYYSEKTSLKKHNFYLVKTDGSLLVWGDNERGELGFGNTTKVTTPTLLMSGVRDVKYAEGNGESNISPYLHAGHVFVIKEDDSLWSWGADAMRMHDGRLSDTFTKTPQKRLDNVKYVSSDDRVAVFALTHDGELYIWGAVSGYTTTPVDWATELDWTGFTTGSADGSVSSTGDIVGHSYVSEEFHNIVDNVRAMYSHTYDTYYITTSNELFSWKNDVSTKVMSNVSMVCGDYLCTMNNELWRYAKDAELLPAPQKVMDGAAGVLDNGSSTFVVKTDGTLLGSGSDMEHELMGKGGGKLSNPFITLWSGVKLPYSSTQQTQPSPAQPVQPVQPAAEELVGTFTDVKKTEWCAEPVAWAVENKVTEGTTATTFSPNRTCTDMQILTFMYRAAGSPAPVAAGKVDNISETAYYYNAALWALENGMIDEAWTTRNDPCTRASTVYYLWQLAGKPESNGAAFDDVPQDAEYAAAVSWAEENGITGGVGDNKFAPERTCTRGHIVTFLYRYYANAQ